MLLRILAPLAVAMALILQAAAAPAACYADYKAKRDGGPLQLHYGVIELPQNLCNDAAARRAEIERRLAADGWTLLSVVSTFGREGLDERRGSASDYFLRY
ncbi:hypothetical protein EKE94_11505 [Mesobaculum littorinae]|uniref:DUF4177 domain-containing protein n=1 Tax=Mesobaculum littorinae TaxID=2486419 RepID=A0A438AH77_9RHOB|nr:hypothetical protein [Mesobaculum littorinae]RVV98079.1 hypothetical protein EKE94_11505 [Mesobaculum littorinae]